jgi:Ca2+-transporting ATPase
LITSAEVLRTPLTEKITHFSTILLYLILALAGLTFLVGYLRGENWVDMFMASVALAVGAIPEGLPAAITITLAIGVARMAKRNAIIRKLPAVETLGSTTVICSDKTGTLTQNQMTVGEIIAAGISYGVIGAGYKPEGEFRIDGKAIDPGSNYALIECVKAGLLCNDSSLRKVDGRWRVDGDPTEGALIVSALKAGLDPKELERALPRIDTIPFESKHQFMATLHDQGPGKPKIAYLKGSIESICMECGVLIDQQGDVQIAETGQAHAWVEDMAAKGLRVLAFARLEMPAETTKITHADFDQTLEFLGLQAMMDPPRPEAITAVEAVHQAGVRVKMITGDHAATAAAIGNQMQLCYPECSWHTESVITGKEMSQLSDFEFIEKAEQTAVFARVSPEQKLRLVEALQARNHVAAMTGDGVNDAPALRQANIGVAMGITGTEVAKEAADMVLTDDNFATIEAAVEEGRGVFDNLRKFITWTLPTNIGEGLSIMAAVVAGTRLPILPLQILWINMTTALLLGLMLAFEPKEPGLMSRPPRAPEKPILTRPLLIRVIIVSLMLLAGAFGLFELNIRLGTGEEIARTVAVNVFVFGEMFYLFNCRSMIFSMFEVGLFSNPWLIIGVAVMTLLQVLFTYIPLMNQLFDSAPISMVQWIEILGVSAAIYLIIGIEKKLQRRNAESLT